MIRRLVLVLLVLVCALALAAPSFAKTDPGQTIFKTKGCAACHTLAAAGAKGKVGPNLDVAKPTYAEIVTRVTNGKGAMPSFKKQLSAVQIKAVAKWVSTHYKKPSK